MATPALGLNARLGIGPDAGGVATVGLDFDSESLTLNESRLDMAGMRGTRSHPSTSVRTVYQQVSGNTVHRPRPVELATLLPYLLGGTPAGTSYPLAELLPLATIQTVKGTKLFTYRALSCGGGTFSAGTGGPLALTLNWMGTTESPATGNLNALTLDNTTSPFVMPDSAGAIIVNGTTVEVFNLTIAISNAVQQRQVNALTATATYSTDRIVTWTLSIPYGDNEALYGLPDAGVAVSAVFTNGGTSLSFSSPKVSFPRQTPPVAGRDEIPLTLSGQARYSAAINDELVCVLDSSP